MAVEMVGHQDAVADRARSRGIPAFIAHWLAGLRRTAVCTAITAIGIAPAPLPVGWTTFAIFGAAKMTRPPCASCLSDRREASGGNALRRSPRCADDGYYGDYDRTGDHGSFAFIVASASAHPASARETRRP